MPYDENNRDNENSIIETTETGFEEEAEQKTANGKKPNYAAFVVPADEDKYKYSYSAFATQPIPRQQKEEEEAEHTPKRKNSAFKTVFGTAFALLAIFVVFSVIFLRYRYDIRVVRAEGSISIVMIPKSEAVPGGESSPPLIQTGDPDDDRGDGIPAGPIGRGVTLGIQNLPRTRELSLTEIYKKCINSVVSVRSYVSGGAYTGTGIIMSEDGYIVTNSHIVEAGVRIEVLLENGEVYEAAMVGRDEQSDLAVLKISASGLTSAEFGDSVSLEVGESVVAIGNPMGERLRGTMTDGIISAINRDIKYNGHTMTLIQTNAAINDGNSGGPLINMHGQVIGITNMKMTSYYSTIEGIGFAIPVSSAKPIIDELLNQGYVAGRPSMGLIVRDLSESIASYYRLPKAPYVETVHENSDAYSRGIRAGDVIVAIEGQDVETRDQLNYIKNQFLAGDTVTLTIYRSGGTFDVSIELMDANDFPDY